VLESLKLDRFPCFVHGTDFICNALMFDDGELFL
jgi:hypothetical protein